MWHTIKIYDNLQIYQRAWLISIYTPVMFTLQIPFKVVQG